MGASDWASILPKAPRMGSQNALQDLTQKHGAGQDR